ncbi:MAG: hypothetical protein NT113_01405 [Hyphomicrobiales bacterium]|nr:hypothetical protein [Hyphomicrobiales bacterium]
MQIRNPYATSTKGEMLRSCADQTLLRGQAARSTSCGRFQRFNYRHCGRCVPCHVRRAAFCAWGVPDTTTYVYTNLGRDDAEHAGFDDVRAVAMAIRHAAGDGLGDWLGPSLSSWCWASSDRLPLPPRPLSQPRPDRTGSPGAGDVCALGDDDADRV